MTTVVTGKWGRGVYMGMKRFHNILKILRSKINMQNEKERNNTKHTIAAR